MSAHALLSGGIPKVIHRIWFGPMEPAVAAFGARWAELHPGWEVRTWREWDVPALRNQLWFDRATQPAQRADIVRLELLERFGGVYVDADQEPLRPLDPLIDATECFFGSEDGRWLSTGVIGARPGHPFIVFLVDGIGESVLAHPDAPVNEQTGPRYVTRRWLEYCDQPDASPVAVFPPALFYPYHFSEPERRDEDFPDAYAVHHWAKTWVDAPPEA